jgi:hypothetical protein
MCYRVAMPEPHDPVSRFLPPGFPRPDPEVLDRLRQNILKETRTKYAPEAAELAAIIAADEAGVDLSAIDPAEIWLSPPDAREPVFQLLRRLLGEMAGD